MQNQNQRLINLTKTKIKVILPTQLKKKSTIVLTNIYKLSEFNRRLLTLHLRMLKKEA